jgi:hypothetical protein
MLVWMTWRRVYVVEAAYRISAWERVDGALRHAFANLGRVLHRASGRAC